MKVLQLVTSAYRATNEEQDDTILWLTLAMRTAGGDLDVLLTGNAVNYVVRGQDASGLAFGTWKQTQPLRIEHDLANLVSKGARVYALREDLVERGLDDLERVEGVTPVSRTEVAALMDEYDHVWRW